MKIKSLFFLSLFLLTSWSSAQVLKPAQWVYHLSSNDAKPGQEIDIFFDVKIDDGWYLYSSAFDCEDGPIKTSISFEQPYVGYELVGGLVAINPTTKYDDIFECEIKIFKKHAQFRQRIKVLEEKFAIYGTYEYQVCAEIDGKCILGEGDFLLGTQVAGLPLKQSSISEARQVTQNKGPYIDKNILGEESRPEKKSFFLYLLFAFVLGLTSIITPCVFPIIPMTVTFFLKEGQKKEIGIRNAMVFGASIIVIYTLAGTLFAYTLGPEGLNALATHWIPNLFVFVLFLFFALSFLGLYEINAPTHWVNKMDRQADKRGLIGVFFMAATLVLVSFSCTLPIVGNVMVMASGGQLLKPVLAMFSYALAFSIPFTFFAVFPEWIKAMPKSGQWLNSVKVTLGFLELALALKFLSIADQAYHWRILDRDTYLILWIVLFSMLGFYLLGKLRLAHDSPLEKISVPRLILSVGVFSFTLYLIPGLFGAPLKLLAGYIPPQYTLGFDLSKDSSSSKKKTSCDVPKYADFLHLPHGLTGYFDYGQALACARKLNKPLFIDFTGHGCTNCREMEAVVWSDPQVLERLRNDFVIAALYVDDKTLLPASEWIESSYDHKLKKTIGKQNADLQIANLENNAQPFYVLVGEDERVLAWPYGYSRDTQKFIHFLNRGKKKYEELYGNNRSTK